MNKNFFSRSLRAFAPALPLFMVCSNLVLTSQAQPLTPPSPEQTNATGRLVVAVQGLEQIKGQVCLSLFNKAQGFPSKASGALQSRCVEVTNSSMTVTFEGLQTGNYAVAVFHDINKDGTLNQNRLGIPTERFGFSNNPRIIAGPPKFSDSSVLLAGQETTIQIKLRGLLG
jgi:uncharacterized protein (DUF2141 family)